MTTQRALACYADMRELGDTGGCGPTALAILTDTNTRYGSPYGRAASDLAAHGRIKGKGTFMSVMIPCFRRRGYDLLDVTQMLRDHGAKTAMSLSWTLAKDYPHKNADGLNNDRFLIRYSGHYAAAMNGIIHDWSAGTKKHIVEILKLIPRDHEATICIMEPWREDIA